MKSHPWIGARSGGRAQFSRHLKDRDEEQNQKYAPDQDQKSEKTEEEQTGTDREITLNYELGLREELVLEEKTGRDHSNLWHRESVIYGIGIQN